MAVITTFTTMMSGETIRTTLNTNFANLNAGIVTGLLPANNLSDLASAATARTNLGLVIGTHVQAWDADLDTWATKTAPSGTVVGTTDTQTLTNKRVDKRVVALTDAATVDWSADTTDIGTVTLGGNRTLGAPSGTPVNGQMFELRVRQDGTGSRTLAYNAIFRFGSDVVSPTLTTTAAKTDYLLFQYNATDTKWDCLSVVKGY